MIWELPQGLRSEIQKNTSILDTTLVKNYTDAIELVFADAPSTYGESVTHLNDILNTLENDKSMQKIQDKLVERAQDFESVTNNEPIMEQASLLMLLDFIAGHQKKIDMATTLQRIKQEVVKVFEQENEQVQLREQSPVVWKYALHGVGLVLLFMLELIVAMNKNHR